MGARVYTVTGHFKGFRLDRFLQAMIPRLSRRRVQRAIGSRVSLSWHPVPRPSLRVVPGGRVAVHDVDVDEPDLPEVSPRVIHEDGSLLAVDKPAGLLVHPTHTCRRNNLVHLMRAARPGQRIALGHRLDRETSGVLVIAKTVEASRGLARQFAGGRVDKRYLAVVHGDPASDEGTLDRPLGVRRELDVVFRRSAGGLRAQPARTDFRVLSRAGRYALLEIRPRTGRRHQIRAHLADAGHPIVGDKLYATDAHSYLRFVRHGLDDAMRESLVADRQLLHASEIAFDHPDGDGPIRLNASPPGDFARFVDSAFDSRTLPVPDQGRGRAGGGGV